MKNLKFLAILVSSVFMLSIYACGGGDGGDDVMDDPSSDGVEDSDNNWTQEGKSYKHFSTTCLEYGGHNQGFDWRVEGTFQDQDDPSQTAGGAHINFEKEPAPGTYTVVNPGGEGYVYDEEARKTQCEIMATPFGRDEAYNALSGSVTVSDDDGKLKFTFSNTFDGLSVSATFVCP